jgi:cytochrome c oxidase cbb3-type subunit 3
VYFLFYASFFLDCLYGSRSFELIIRRWSLKVAQAKIDIAEYMKTAPDMMDEKR